MHPRTVIVTGAGRGIGRACAEAFLDAGWTVAAAVRDVGAARSALGARPGLTLVRVDLSDPASIAPAVDEATAALGEVGCLVNNAGHALMGAADDTDFDAVRAMFQVNFFGAAELTARVLPGMRRRGSGTVVCVSSIGARIVHPLLGYYHATKFAMSAWAEAMRLENARSGVRVHVIEPGFIESDFARATVRTGALADGAGPYAPLGGELREAFTRVRARVRTEPRVVAAAVLAAASDPGTPYRVPVGADAVDMAAARESMDDDAFHAWLMHYEGIDLGATPPPGT